MANRPRSGLHERSLAEFADTLERERRRTAVDFETLETTLRAKRPELYADVPADRRVLLLDGGGLLSTLRTLPDGAGTPALVARLRLDSDTSSPAS